MYTLGLDYGTNSCRAIIVDCTNGNVVGISVYNYPSGIDGVLADSANPLVARQNPADYISGLESSVLGAIAEAKKNDSKTNESNSNSKLEKNKENNNKPN